jgi:DNA-binding NtrC family response regulator
LAKLGAYKWPGNIRELKNLVKQMIILRPGEKITGTDINMILGSSTPKHQTHHIGAKGAARLLDLPRSTLQYRLKKFGINPGDYVK